MKPLGFIFLLLFTLPVLADPITYSINQASATAAAAGTITTDGTIGSLSSANILAFSFTASQPAHYITVPPAGGKGVPTIVLVPAQSISFDAGVSNIYSADLTATLTGLFYNFADLSDNFAAFSGNGAGICFSGGFCSGGDQGYQGSGIFLGSSFVELDASKTSEQIGIVATPVAETPEPNGLLLLGTGVLALANRVRTSARRTFQERQVLANGR